MCCHLPDPVKDFLPDQQGVIDWQQEAVVTGVSQLGGVGILDPGDSFSPVCRTA